MRLVPKISLALAAMTAAAIAMSAVGFKIVIAPRYERLDRETAELNGARISKTVEEGLARFAGLTRDWAHWDATYDFMASQSPAYIAENLKYSDLSNVDVDAIVFLDARRKIVFQRAFNLQSRAEETWFDGARPFDLTDWQDFGTNDLFSDRTGIVALQGRPAMVSLSPILTSAKTGPVRGTLVFVRLLTPERVDQFEDSIQLVLKLSPFDQMYQGLFAADGGGVNGIATRTGDNDIVTFVRISDPSGKPTFAAEASTPRRFHEMGLSELRAILIGVSGVAIALYLFSIGILTRLISKPLRQVSERMALVEKSGVLAVSEHAHAADEIGAIEGQFDSLIRTLAESRRQLEEQSYFSGMADLSASALHNVRNALSPIQTAVWVADQAMDGMALERLIDAAEQMKDPEETPERKHKLIELIVASATLANENRIKAREAHERIGSFSVHVNEILSNYDDISRGSHRSEPVSVALVIREAAQFARAAQSPAVTLRVNNHLPGTAAIDAQRIVLVQIMSNIVANAVASMRRAGKARGTMEIDALESSRNERAFVEIRITDDGEGIAKDDIGRIFERGYSKRHGSAGGLGLYWCAKAAAAFDGAIIAETLPSGARFTMRFPMSRQSVAPGANDQV